MSEFLSTLSHPEHDNPPLFDERSVLETLRPEALRDFIEECGYKIAELRRLELLASDVLTGYGE